MRILIVDDRPLGARKLRDDILTAEPDYQVTVAVTDGATSAAERAIKFVREQGEHFDVFLIDDNMGAGPNGTELMAELRQLSPSSEAIIFTAYGDEAGKQRAIEAGARAYITRPVNEKELLWQLHGVQRDQETRRERDWLHLLAATIKALQEASTIQDAGQAIVKGAQQLGFQRARLRMICGGQGEQIEMIGISQIGNVGLMDKFTTVKRTLSDLPYSRKVLLEARKPTLFHARELGRAPSDEYVMPPKDDWFKVPLFVGDTPLGTLSLDNGVESIKYTSDDRRQLEQLLDLFGKQAAAALERARLQEEAQRKADMQELLNEISLAVTEQAAKGDLHATLDMLRRQIYEHLHLGTGGFIVSLLDQSKPASHYLECCYEYKNGQVKPVRHWCDYENDPAKAWITQLIKAGRPGQDLAGHQIGIPLKIKEDVIGVMLIDGRQAIPSLGETVSQQLIAVAAHVAGPIQVVYREDREKGQRKRKQLRDQLIERLRRLAGTDENHFWHAVLTFASHREGYSFNRVVLFRYNAEESAIQGWMGIGHFSLSSWQRDVAADVAAGEQRSFAAYLASSSVGHLHITPLATAVLNWRRQLSGDQQDPLHIVCEQGERLVLAAADLKRWLPMPEFIPHTMRPSAECALIPLKYNTRVLGVLMVDNAMDDKPVQPDELAALQDLLAEASQVLDDAGEGIRLRRQGESYERILKFSWLLMTQAANASLKELLTKLCQEACNITKADYVVLYPLSRDGINYDTTAIATAGTPRDRGYLFQHMPRPQGTAAYILRQGTLAVTDVTQSRLEFDGLPLKQQRYIIHEGIAAFLGVPIRVAATARPLGVLYLDFRRPQDFSTSDILQAEHLASVASTVIGTAYRVEDEAERYTRESALLQAIQEESLAADTTEKKVISVVLQKAQELFDRQANLLLMLRKWEPGKERETIQERFRYLQWNPLTYYEDTDPSDALKELIGTAFERGEMVREGDELAVPIKTAYRTMGCISVTQSREVPPARVERLANATAVALDNIRREVRLRATLKAVRQVIEPTKLKQTLEAVITATRDASHGLACVTLWYRDPVSKGHMLGAHWGLLPDSQDAQNPGGAATQTQHEIVRRIMESKVPIWVEDIEAGGTDAELELSRSSFVQRQEIISIAAFPLWVKNECIGALFFNYRRRHRFSPGERDTLTIFAAIAAASIHDAQLLEQARQGEERLDVARKVVEAVGTELNLDEVLRKVLAELKKHFDKPDAQTQPYVMLYDEGEDALYLPAVARVFAPVDNPLYVDQLRLRLDGSDKGIVCRVARKAREKMEIYVENTADIRSDPDFLPFNSRTVSLLCAGLMSAGRLWGVLAVSSSKHEAFDEQDKLLLELAAQQALIAMERAEQAAKLASSKRRQTVMAWQSEIAHAMKGIPSVLRRLLEWFELKGISESSAAEWYGVLSKLIQELEPMASATVPTMAVIGAAKFIDEIREWVTDKKWAGILLEPELSDRELTLYCDHHLLKRSIQNLIVNAAEEMEFSGRIQLICREFADSSSIEFEVRDTGRGILKEARSKIGLERWSSKDPTRGDGLYNTALFMEMVGGVMQILPDLPGTKGARIALRIPKAQVMSASGLRYIP